MKYLPPELADWFFPFNWNVQELWNVEGKIEQRDLTSLLWHLDYPFWSSVQGKGILFDIRPKTVLENMDTYPWHKERIYKADLNYPLIISEYKGKEIIMDGLHRFAKASLQDEKIITIRMINSCEVKKI